MKLTRFVESAAPSLVLAIAVMVAIAPSSSGAVAGQLWVGGATVDITPDGPVALAGQRHLRIASKVESPVTATALAVETRDGNESIDHAVFVSCDLVAIREGIAEMLREKLKDVLPELDPQKVVLSIAHTQLWLGGNRCSDTLYRNERMS